MQKSNIVVVFLGIGGLAASVISAKKLFRTNATSEVAKDVAAEKKYHGVLLSVLNRIAESINSRNYCTIDNDYLMLHYKSNRGHQTNHAQLYVDKFGKLVSRNPGFAYPGQVKSGESEFLNRVNENMTFQ